MAGNIEALLDEILNAVYGEEVRSAIHDSIAECYDDVTESKTIADTATADVTEALTTFNSVVGDVSEYIAGDVTIAKSIAAVQTATEKAKDAETIAVSAAQTANSAAITANTNANRAETAATQARTATESAQSVVNQWSGSGGLSEQINTAISDANTATNLASSSAQTAETAAENANAARDSIQSLETDVQAIIDEWNGTDTASGLSDTIDTAITNANTARDQANQARDAANEVVAAWNTGVGSTPAISTQIDDAIANANSAATSATSATATARTAANNATTWASEAQRQASSAESAASIARSAAGTCQEVTNNAQTSIASADTAASNANAAADAIEFLEVTSKQVAPNIPSSATATFIEDGTTPHWRIHFQLSKGNTGSSMIIKGETFATYSDLVAGVTNPQEGDMYNVGTEPPYDVYRYTGSYWEDQGPIGFTLDDLVSTEIDLLWSSASYIPGSEKKYINDEGLFYLISLIKAAIAAKVDRQLKTGSDSEYKVLTDVNFSTELETLVRTTTPNRITNLEQTKVNAIAGMGLSTNDYAANDRSVVHSLPTTVDETGSVVAAIDTALDSESHNLVQNAPVAAAVNSLTTQLTTVKNETPLATAFALVYNPDRQYALGEYCVYERNIYRCINQSGATGAWNANLWEKIYLVSAVSEAVSDISSLQETTGSLNTSMQTAETNITTLQTDVAEAQQDIDDFATFIDTIGENFAQLFSTGETYDAGEYCVYESAVYICHTPVTTAGEWTGEANWERVTVQGDISNIIHTFAKAYSPSSKYVVGEFCTYNNGFYRCNTEIGVGGDGNWRPEHWDAITVEGAINAIDYSPIVTPLQTQITEKDLYIDIPVIDNLSGGFTVNNPLITEDHVVANATLGNPGAMIGNWTVTTSNGSLVINGTGKGSTSLQLLLTKVTTITSQEG